MNDIGIIKLGVGSDDSIILLSNPIWGCDPEFKKVCTISIVKNFQNKDENKNWVQLK